MRAAHRLCSEFIIGFDTDTSGTVRAQRNRFPRVDACHVADLLPLDSQYLLQFFRKFHQPCAATAPRGVNSGSPWSHQAQNHNRSSLAEFAVIALWLFEQVEVSFRGRASRDAVH